ncbi:MAG TPA: DinB family protein [Vicinamibacteria bacterium]|nr:DinB family protein [Vicinamibacteria bacterium]
MTTPTDVAVLLRALEAMPADLQAAAGEMSEAAARTPPADGGFCLIEQAWHLADLEREGYGERIRRLLAEEDPELPDFDGARVAVSRNYRAKSLAAGSRLSGRRGRPTWPSCARCPSGAWERGGRQAGVGAITLRDVPRMMRAQDDGHRAEIAALLAGRPLPPESVSA